MRTPPDQAKDVIHIAMLHKYQSYFFTTYSSFQNILYQSLCKNHYLCWFVRRRHNQAIKEQQEFTERMLKKSKDILRKGQDTKI